MKWTPAQREAIEHDADDLLVAAGAGAGKTGVLTERVARRIASGRCRVDELLVVTFTEAAAAEMRVRIAGKLQAALADARQRGDLDTARRLEAQVVLLDAGHICTLHSFCSHLVRENFQYLGIDPAFEILDDDEAVLVRQEVLDELLEEYYNAAGPKREQFERLLQWCQADRDDTPLRQILLRLDAKVNSLPDPDTWWAHVRRNVVPRDSLQDCPWLKSLQRLFHLTLETAMARLDQARMVVHGDSAEWLTAYQKPMLQLVDYLGEIAGALARPDFRGALDEVLARYPIPRLPAVRGDPPGKTVVQKLLGEIKRTLGDLSTWTACSDAELLLELDALAPQVRMLFELCERYREAFTQAKAQRGQLDFNDLERYALRLLLYKEVRQAVAGQFREVLVDEYQDISPVQDEILAMVAGKQDRGPAGRLFMVGDLKQSIYRFRLAEPDIFNARMQQFAEGKGGRLIHLAENFRSRRVVIDLVNLVFSRLMLQVPTLTSDVGGPVYDQAAQLQFAALPYDEPAAPPDAPVEVHLLDDPTPSKPDDEEPEESDREAADLAVMERAQVQARVVARRLRQLLGFDGQPAAQVWDDHDKQFRPARPRDVVVLLRTMTRIAPMFAEELTAMGLPVYADQSTGYFEAVEVGDVRSLLAVLDNPHQDVALAALLRSPLMALVADGPPAPGACAAGALTVDELIAVRQADRDGDLFDAVRAAADQSADDDAATTPKRSANDGDATAAADLSADDDATAADGGGSPALRRRLARLLEQLDRWRTMARRRPLSELLGDIFRRTGYLDYVSGLKAGPQRRANLLDLARRARQFDAFARQGLARFSRFLDELESSGEDLGVPRALSEADDVVRVMSVHRSKGLEFPIVVLADLEHRFNLEECSHSVLFHSKLWLGLRCVDRQRRLRYPSLPHHLIATQLRIETALEQMRLLYVAMTRARERLILFASDKRMEKLLVDRAPPPDAGTLANARRWLDWLLPVLADTPAGADLAGQLARNNDRLPPTLLQAGDGQLQFRVYSEPCLQSLGLLGQPPAELPPWRTQAAAGQPIDAPADLGDDDEAIFAEARAQLEFDYPHAAATTEPAKRSVSELKHLFDARREADEQVAAITAAGPAPDAIPPTEPDEPAPVADDAITAPPVEASTAAPEPDAATLTAPDADASAEADGSPETGAAGEIDAPPEPEIPAPPWDRPAGDGARARGTATHAVLQRLDLSADLADANTLAGEIARLQSAGLLDPHDVKLVDRRAIGRLFASEIGKLLRADPSRVRREWPFSLAVPAGEIPGASAGAANDTVLVQGIIDVLVEQSDGSLLVLDFKTDNVRGDAQIRQRAEDYRLQLEWYGRAAGTVLGRPVSRRAIYFLRPGELVEL